VLVLAAGLAGADRWLYVHLCQRINTADASERNFADLYQRTKPLWMLARLAVHFVGAAALAWVAIMQTPRRRAVLAAALAVGVVAAGANLLQAAIGRARPNAAMSQWTFYPPLSGLIQAMRGHGQPDGFPSGEVAAAFALAAVLARVAPAFAPPVYALAALTALTRWLPGMHYLSDVAAGAVLGAWAGDACCRWLQRRLRAG
jgi:membrane-associated phospholipid phosphatase